MNICSGQMHIKLDTREKALQGALHAVIGASGIDSLAAARLEIAQLPLGDAVVCGSDGSHRIVVERKTVADLAASISDGRYREQSYRLKGCGLPSHCIHYVIEGNVESWQGSRVTRRTLYSTMASLVWTKGFVVTVLPSTAATARWLLALADRVARAEAPQGPATYVDVASHSRKAQLTPGNMLSVLLIQVPGVSTATAKAIQAKFATMADLVDALKENRHALKDIRMQTKAGKERRIAASAAAAVARYLGAG